jgi:2-isopropylmalate synthase
VQRHTDDEGGEVSAAALWAAFSNEYLPLPDRAWGRFALRGTRLSTSQDGLDQLVVDLADAGEVVSLQGQGNGPIAAFTQALADRGVDVRVLDYHEHAMSAGGDATAAAYVECAIDGRVLWGVGIDANIVTASLKAVVSAVNRWVRDGDTQVPA